MKKITFPEFKDSFLKSIGPSLVTLGLGIGGGEYILWPFLVTQFGFGILWAALLGITFQLFIILEVGRYTAVKGESIVHGFSRITKIFPMWLVLSTVIGFGWPGFAATAATLLSSLIGISATYHRWVSIVILLLCGAILLLGQNVYRKVETIQKIVVPLSFLILLYFFYRTFDSSTVITMAQGVLGIGDGFLFIPEGLDLAVFLGAFAYAGSGGNFLLGQSFYTLEKGYGYSKFAEKLDIDDSSRAKGKMIVGEIIPATDEKSIKNFKKLRRFQILEGITVFWGLGFITIAILGYLAQFFLQEVVNIPQGVAFLLLESQQIASQFGGIWGIAFTAIGVFALLSVQLGALDIMGRFNAWRVKVAVNESQKAGRLLESYRIAVTIQLVIGIFLFVAGISEPLSLVVIGAVFNAFAMAIIAFSILFLNHRFLPNVYKPGNIQTGIILLSGFSYLLPFLINVVDAIKKYVTL